MRVTKEEFSDVIITVGMMYGICAIGMIMKNEGIYSTIKILVYRMFIVGKDNEVDDCISLIREYCIELEKNGDVVFDS